MLDASRFQEVLILGHGAFGSIGVFRDIYSQRQVVIKKITFHDENELEAVKKEVVVMQKLKNEFVVRCFGYFLKEKSINIVMEYCQNGDLQKYIDNMKKEHKIITEQEFFDLAAQLASGKNRLKIGDFGLSKVIDDQDYANTVAGTRLFLSPEMLKKWSYTEKVDQWSLGIILYILAELRHPFNISSEVSLVLGILNEKPAPFMNMKNESAQKLILSLLDKDADSRQNAEKILHLPEISALLYLKMDCNKAKLKLQKPILQLHQDGYIVMFNFLNQ
ncbi:MAG: putative protein kinase domain protein [Streblomastix strix]|uniref:non-specific serine/threonine protein kinase n=1 Tax=Streblomastix strix TaxID=222440 RepID=A0A5J4WVB1_9EUKA|nr:MAG: putative protein kinase domain protein [Streblomastix strix]